MLDRMRVRVCVCSSAPPRGPGTNTTPPDSRFCNLLLAVISAFHILVQAVDFDDVALLQHMKPGVFASVSTAHSSTSPTVLVMSLSHCGRAPPSA
jgi:hypothetical protein